MHITKFLDEKGIRWAYIIWKKYTNKKGKEVSAPFYLNTNKVFKYPDFYENNNWENNQELTKQQKKNTKKHYKLIDEYASKTHKDIWHKLEDNEANREHNENIKLWKEAKSKVGIIYLTYALQDIQVIDVDDITFNDAYKNMYFEAKPYCVGLNDTYQYKSRSKRYSHYIVSTIDVDKSKNMLKIYDKEGEGAKHIGELLVKQAPWVRINERVVGKAINEKVVGTGISTFPVETLHTTSPTPESPTISFTNEKNPKYENLKIEDYETLLCDESVMPPSVYKDYDQWLKVGLSLKGLFGDTEDTYDVFDDFSSLCDEKYDEENNKKLWNSWEIDPSKVSPNTIPRLAWDNNPTKLIECVVKNQLSPSFISSFTFGRYPLNKKLLRKLCYYCGANYIIENQFTKEEEEEINECKKEKDKDSLIRKFMQKYYNHNVKILMKYFTNYTASVSKGAKGKYYFTCNYDDRGQVIKLTDGKDISKLIENWNHYKIKNKYIFGKAKPTVGLIWSDYDYQRVYDELTFEPNKKYVYDRDRYCKFNLWNSWKYTFIKNFKVDEDLIKNITRHLKEVICDDNDELYRYHLKMFKLILSGIKTKVCFVCYGLNRIGKSMLYKYFGEKIIGEDYYLYLPGMDALTDKFNADIANKCFTVCDEINNWEDNKRSNTAANILKSRITETMTAVEKKGIDRYNLPCYNNYAFPTNNPFGVKVEGKDRGRFCFVHASSKYKGDAEYFNQLGVDMGNEEKRPLTDEEKNRANKIGNHFYHFIMQQDTTNFNAEKIPLTKYRIEVEEKATPSTLVFMKWYLTTLQKVLTTEDAQVEITSEELYKKYSKFIDYNELIGNHVVHDTKTFSRNIRNHIDTKLGGELGKCVQKRIRYKNKNGENDYARGYRFKLDTVKDIIERLDEAYRFNAEHMGYESSTTAAKAKAKAKAGVAEVADEDSDEEDSEDNVEYSEDSDVEDH